MQNNSELLDNDAAIAKIDQAGMLAVVASWPELVEQAVKFAAALNLAKVSQVNQVVVLGMGGSAMAGDLAADLLRKIIAVPIMTVRQYSLPEYVDGKSLVIALSYSGETEETISAVREAQKKKATIVCVTSGGKLQALAAENNYPLVNIPSGYQPRAALAFMLIPLLFILHKAGLIASPEQEISEAIMALKKLRNEYGPGRPARNNLAKQAAKKLVDKTIIIFGAFGTTGGVAYRYKTQFNENSKSTALPTLFPELNHNEIVNLGQLDREKHNFALIVLREESDNERVKKRIEITKSLLSRQLGGLQEFSGQGKSLLARLLSLIYLGDFISVYLAILQGIDPTPVEAITRLKKEISR